MNKFALLLGVIVVSTLGATAQEGGKGKGRGQGGPGGPGARGPRELPAEIVKKFDENGNGKLEPKEMEAARAARKAEWDALTPEEREAKMKERRAAMEKRRAEWEKLTPAEREAKMKEMMMKRFDKDGNGQLNEEEQAAFDKAVEAMKNRRGPGNRGEGAPGKGKGKGKGPKA